MGAKPHAKTMIPKRRNLTTLTNRVEHLRPSLLQNDISIELAQELALNCMYSTLSKKPKPSMRNFVLPAVARNV